MYIVMLVFKCDKCLVDCHMIIYILVVKSNKYYVKCHANLLKACSKDVEHYSTACYVAAEEMCMFCFFCQMINKVKWITLVEAYI